MRCGYTGLVGMCLIQNAIQIFTYRDAAPSGLNHGFVTYRFNGDDRVEVE